jgi:uncharacterized membrane protein YphA (DoxX/SURF4 family)
MTARKLGSWLVALALAVVFARAGYAKLAGHAGEVRAFARWGYPPWFRIMMGAAEVTTALVLLIPRLRILGALGVGGTMAGAIFTYLRSGEAAKSWLPALLIAGAAALAALELSAARSARSPR